MTNIDKQYFIGRLSDIKMSQRELARRIGIDASSLNHTLHGKRKMSQEEANSIAKQLGVSVLEVMRHAGVDVRDDIKVVKICGAVLEDARVEMFDCQQGSEIAPSDVPEGSFVLQCRSVSSPYYGWINFVSGEQSEPSKLIDRPCLAKVVDDGHFVGIVKRGLRHGRYNIIGYQTSIVYEDMEIEWASPVFWVKPA